MTSNFSFYFVAESCKQWMLYSYAKLIAASSQIFCPRSRHYTPARLSLV